MNIMGNIKWFLENCIYKFLGLISPILKLRAFNYIKHKTVKSINKKIIDSNPGIKTFNNFISTFKPDSDTVFILGSGDSINAYSEPMWKEIKSKFSIGFNYWVINDFVPNLYFVETPTYFEHWDVLRKELLLKKEEYKNVPIVFKDLINKRFYRWKIQDYIDTINNNVFLYEDIPFIVSNLEEFEKQLNYLNKKGLLYEKSYPIIHKTGSVFFLLNFALKFGFKKIVLCGVDLSHNNYFFHTNKEYYQSKGIPLPPVFHNDNIHPTFNPDRSGDLTIDKIINIFNKEILKPKGIELYVALKSSALYPELPCYFNE